MAIVNLNGSKIMTGLAAIPLLVAAPGLNGAVRSWSETIEIGSDDSANSTYLMARLPSNARLLGASTISLDELASAGAPTIDVGVFNLDGKAVITDDDDAINSGIDATTEAPHHLIGDIANYGNKLYEFVDGQTADPLGDLNIMLTLKDAAVNVGGTVTIEIFYALD